jgi:acetolactate synthase-1/3 small subunit
MTIVIDSDQTSSERVSSYLYKLVNVIQVSDLTTIPSVSRDLGMVKVATTPSNRTEIMQLVDVYRARIVDVGNDSMIVEITGTEDKIDSFVDVLRPYGIIEMVRTGIVSMERGSAPALKKNGNGNGHNGSHSHAGSHSLYC